MRIIDAHWEKRNLGVDTAEFEIESGDGIEVVSEIIANEKQYNVVKIPAGNTGPIFEIAKKGYIFVESMFNLFGDVSVLSNPSLSSVQKRLVDDVSYVSMSMHDKYELFEEIKGGMFDTDRIFIDSAFADGLAATRYINWLGDAEHQGAALYKLVYKNHAIGFFASKKKNDKVHYPFLAGMYARYKKSGLGLNAIWQPILCSKNLGAEKIDTYVSGNNIGVLKLHLSLGFEIKGVHYVFVKHN